MLALLWVGGWLLAADTSRFTYELAVAYTVEVMSPLAGAPVQPVWMDNIDVTLTLPLTPRTTLFLYGLGNQGGSISAHVGNAQSVSNIEAPTSWRLYEAFIEHVSATGRFSVLAGLYDLSSEFDVLSAAGLFINSSFGTGAELAASRPRGPSIFPVTSVGLRVRLGLQQASHYAGYLQAVALDGLPGHPEHPRGTHIVFGRNDGLLLVAEAGALMRLEAPLPDGSPIRLASRLHEHTHQHKLALGVWYYTARFQWLDANRSQRGNAGAYLLGETRLYGESPRTLWAFLRVGVAHPRVNRFGAYTGGGFSGQGWVPGRPTDRMGVAVAAAHNSSAYGRLQRRQGTPVHRTEWVLEGTYLVALDNRLQLQLDLQWVRHPDTRAGSVLVGGLRLLWSP